MIRLPNVTNDFSPANEPVVNPYIGFTSYQKFRGDPLFPDVVVRPENNMTETEQTERYPVKQAVGENGNSQGFYPDTAVAYIRVLWKDFEPERNIYDFDFIENILHKARKKQQTVMLRLMPHSTRRQDDVPDWLKRLIPCPERPDGRRVKDSPKDPLFLTCFGDAVKALADRFDKDPTLDVMDISLPGAWGEGYRLCDYPPDALKALVDVYTGAFQNTRLIGQAAAPELVQYACKTVPCGWRGDGVGEQKHLNEKYPAAAEQVKDIWKSAPVSFESYWWLCEWDRKGWDIDEVIEKTLSWHISTFNAKSFPIPEKWREKTESWIGRMGYHFHIRSFSLPDTAAPGDTLNFRMQLENRGVAPLYNALGLRLRLSLGDKSFDWLTDVDARKWLPGEHTVSFAIVLGNDLPPGEYTVGISVSGERTPVIRFESQGEHFGAYFKTGVIKIIEKA